MKLLLQSILFILTLSCSDGSEVDELFQIHDEAPINEPEPEPEPDIGSIGNPGIRFSPSVLDYGSVSIANTHTEDLAITNTTEDFDILINGLQLSNSAFTIATENCISLILEPGESCSIQIEFLSLIGGSVNAEIEVDYNIVGYENFQLELDTDVLATLTFAPTDIAGLQFWLDAADTSTLFTDSACSLAATDGNAIGCWQDKSSLGNDATTSGSARPSLESSTDNYVNFVGSAGNNDSGHFFNIPAFDTKIIFMVVEDLGGGAGGHGILSEAHSGGSIYLFALTDGFGGAYAVSFDGTAAEEGTLSFNSGAAFGPGENIGPAGQFPSGLQLVTMEYTNLQSNFVYFAALDNGSGPHYRPIMKVREVLIYDSSLSAPNIALIENYLKEKWGTP